MVEYKNQHYVPRWVLRAWSSDSSLDFLHRSSGQFFNEDLGSVCSGDYFYGTPSVERELKAIEDHHAHPVSLLRQGKSLGDFTPNLELRLRSFVSTQRTRTKSLRSDIESGEWFLRNAVREDLAAGAYEDRIEWKDDFDDDEKADSLVDGSIKSIHHHQLINGIFGFITLEDLSGLILRNATNREFVISDAPIVHDNPRYKDERDLVTGGLANRGLQIYCPIDRRKILLLYDPLTYSFEVNANGELVISSEDIVDTLNLFQFHNAKDIVMFQSSEEDYITELESRSTEIRRRDEIIREMEPESGDAVVHEYAPNYQLPLLSPNLPSCKTGKSLNYAKQRVNTKSEEQRRLVRIIFNKSRYGSDAALIYAIRLFENIVNSETCS